MKKYLFIKTLLPVLIISFLLSGCATGKAEYEKPLSENIASIQSWLDYTNSTFTEDYFYKVIDAITKFRNQYPKEKEVTDFTDAFVDTFLNTSQYLPVRLRAIKSNAESYLAEYSLLTNSKNRPKKLYEETLQFIQTVNILNEELREYGSALLTFSDMSDKYGFQYP